MVKANVCRMTEYLSEQEKKFGWILTGSWELEGRQKNSLRHQILCIMDITEHFDHHFWNLVIIEIEDVSKGNKRQQCNVKTEVVKKFNESIFFENDRYVFHLPSKPDQKEKLMDNKALVIKRTDNLKNLLGKNLS